MKKRGKRKIKIGIVVSNKMNKTVVVKCARRIFHPKYKKVITVFSKFKAHDENNLCEIGDRVKLMETRPLSKEKHWRVVRILQRSQ